MPKSRITIVGLGLVGGSMGLALKKANLDLEVIGHDKDPGVSARAQKRGAVDATKWNLIDACDGAGLIILALPLDAIKDTLAALKSHLAAGTIITDTATTKAPVLEWAKDLPAGTQFIGGNPIFKPLRDQTARGIDGANADLFKNATYCLVASTSASAATIDTLTNFAALLGAKPYFIEAAEHDGLMAGVQHLPVLLATTLAAVTMQSQGWRELGKLAGADFRAATELAPTDDKTAREQFLAHREDLVRWIDVIAEKLHTMRAWIVNEDAAALETTVKNITAERDRWLGGGLDDTEPKANWDETKSSMSRLFLGGLADAGKKRK